MAVPNFPAQQTESFGFFRTTKEDLAARISSQKLVPGFYQITNAVGGTKRVFLSVPDSNFHNLIASVEGEPGALYYYNIDDDTLTKVVSASEGITFDVILEYGGQLFMNSGTINTYRNSYINIVGLELDRVGYTGSISVEITDPDHINLLSSPLTYTIPAESSSMKRVVSPKVHFNPESETNIGGMRILDSASDGSHTVSFKVTAGSQSITRTFTINVSNAPGLGSGSGSGSGSASGAVADHFTYDIQRSYSTMDYGSPAVDNGGGVYTVSIDTISNVAISRLAGDFTLKSVTGTITSLGGNIYQLDITAGEIEDGVEIILSGRIYFTSDDADLFVGVSDKQIEVLNNYNGNESVISISL